MKRYIAQKAMKFDKSYRKGAEIPENVIAKNMINKLVRCKALAVETIAEAEQNKKPEEQTPEEIGQNTEQQEQISEQSQTEQTSQPQTEEQLLQYKKEELEQMAKDAGIEVKQSMTKAEIVALLLQKE